MLINFLVGLFFFAMRGVSILFASFIFLFFARPFSRGGGDSNGRPGSVPPVAAKGFCQKPVWFPVFSLKCTVYKIFLVGLCAARHNLSRFFFQFFH